MTDQFHILALVDPTQEVSPAINRLSQTAKLMAIKPKITVLVIPDLDLVKRKKEEASLVQTLSKIKQPLLQLHEANLEHDVLISWQRDWAQAVLDVTASLGDVSHLYVPCHTFGEDARMSEEVWKLIRNTKVNLTLMKSGASQKRKRILAAIKSQEPSYEKINNEVLRRVKHLAEMYGAEIYIVNGYTDSMNFPDRAQIGKMSGVPNDRIFVVSQPAVESIANIADKIEADLVIIGARRRTGLAALRGQVLEDIIASLKQDVTIVI